MNVELLWLLLVGYLWFTTLVQHTPSAVDYQWKLVTINDMDVKLMGVAERWILCKGVNVLNHMS